MKKQMLLNDERPMITVSIIMPVDVFKDLEQVSHEKEMSSVEALIRFYIGQGLRKDLVELRRKHSAEYAKEILGKHQIDPKIIEEVTAVIG